MSTINNTEKNAILQYCQGKAECKRFLDQKKLAEKQVRRYQAEYNRIKTELADQYRKLYFSKDEVFLNQSKFAVTRVQNAFQYFEVFGETLEVYDLLHNIAEKSGRIYQKDLPTGDKFMRSNDEVADFTYLNNSGILIGNVLLRIVHLDILSEEIVYGRYTTFQDVKISKKRRNNHIRRRRAANVIQSSIRTFFWRPVYPSGRMGFHVRKGLQSTQNILND